MATAITIPLRAVHLATEGHGPSSTHLAVLEPEADDSMSMLEVHAEDFLEQIRPLLLEWFDEVELDNCEIEDLIDALAALPGKRLVLRLDPGGAWDLGLRSMQPRMPRTYARLERRGSRRLVPSHEHRVAVEEGSSPSIPVLDISDDGSGLAIDCDADELRALLMGGALREPGAQAIEIQVVRVQALGNGRYRVGCVVGRGQENVRSMLS